MARVWVTRAQPGADATADRLRALGHDPLVAPLLVVRLTAERAPSLEGVGALAFSSANGVSAFAGLSAVRDVVAYAVGEATARSARRAGFLDVRAGEADVVALARLIATDPYRPAGGVLHVCPAEPAGDLVGALVAAGVEARRAALYETLAVERLPAAVAAALDAGALDVVLVHSPRAGRALAVIATAEPRLRAARALALSPACAAPLAGAGLAALDVAPSPQEEALLSLLPR